ncbi:META domain-containing protein [Brevibacterium sp. 5221]|uniref:META domain-containing protein n=1 Tax=Brevibacterium rongguiense TaxID=2695267 RepID=A0A6N9H983_9MICO|nr:META domain-containing protein [Brevibacterium rongguiense]
MESSQQPTTQEPRSIVGTWGSDEKSHPYLTFSADGRVEGTDGCNGIFTSYEQTNDGAELEPYISTRRACVGIDPWLKDVTRVAMNGDELVAYSGSDRLGVLKREGDTPGPVHS